MNIVDRLIAGLAPERALRRAQARRALQVLANYDAASGGRRTRSWRASPSDADQAGARRQRLAFITRDMIRNTPFAARAQQVIANNVVGDGIIPKIIGSDAIRTRGLAIIERHFDTTDIDADGRLNLYGLQRLIVNTVVESGECFIRRRRRQRADGYAIPLQLQVLEPDYLDDTRDGPLPDGNVVRDGIEYDYRGRRLAYYLYDEHPGGTGMRGWNVRATGRRVPASEVLHVYRVDRPGQRRGVPWMAGIALNLQDLADHQDAELMRQKIAACFAVFRVQPDMGEGEIANPIGSSLRPGAVYDLGPGEDVRFGEPPGVNGFEEFSRVVLRSVASGLGITYEALTGDLSNVNFSSARMGRMEMDRNISSWQWTMMVPQFCQPLGEWFREAWMMQGNPAGLAEMRVSWVPPHRILVDPAREVGALVDKVRAGFASRQGVIRELGHDPERLLAEQAEDAAQADAAGLVFDSDPRRTSGTGLTQARPGEPVYPDQEGADE